MTEPFDPPELAEHPVASAPEESQPFLHSVTSNTPWCLFSIIIHVLVIALIGLVPLVLNTTPQERVEIDVISDPGPAQVSRFSDDDRNSGLNELAFEFPAPDALPASTEPIHESYKSDADPEQIEVLKNIICTSEFCFFRREPSPLEILNDSTFAVLSNVESLTEAHSFSDMVKPGTAVQGVFTEHHQDSMGSRFNILNFKRTYLTKSTVAGCFVLALYDRFFHHLKKQNNEE